MSFPYDCHTSNSITCKSYQAQTESLQKQARIKIDNFGRIDDHYYRGAQPKNRDYQDLAELGIKSVITLTSDDTDPK